MNDETENEVEMDIRQRGGGGIGGTVRIRHISVKRKNGCDSVDAERESCYKVADAERVFCY